jgi:hypothetical protein
MSSESRWILSHGRELDPKRLKPGAILAPDQVEDGDLVPVTGSTTIEALLETAAVKKVNTEDYEYMKKLDEARRRNEQARKRELESELQEFRKLKLKRAIEKRKEKSIEVDGNIKPSLQDTIAGRVRIKPKTISNKLE